MLAQGQRCPRCQTDLTANPPEAHRCRACGAELASSWFVARGKTKQGPLSLDELKQLSRTGQLKPDDMLLQEGARIWRPARSVPGLFDAVSTDQATIDAPQPAPQETASDALRTTPHRPDNTSAPVAVPVSSVPGYEILSELGSGGMGVVYLARQTSLKRLVALKMIRAGAHAGTEAVTRFHIEAEAVARLHHPHIVQIYEVGEHQGQPYCALEYIEGGSLAGRLASRPLPAREAAGLVEKLARAMSSAHQHQIVHRDLKPANVLLTPEGEPKITDFGLAKQLDVDTGQTQSGAIMGTPSYMAPEQAAGKVHDIGPLADVYALGAILYACLTGRSPFKGEHLVETLDRVLHEEPTPPSRLCARLPRDLERICLKCLSKEPAGRYHSALALAQDLERFRAGEPILARSDSLTRKLWRCARRHRVALLTSIAITVVLVVAGVIGLRGSHASRVSALQETITTSLEREPDDWSLEHVETIEADIARLSELEPDRGDSARTALLERWRRILLQSLDQPRLPPEEVKRLEAIVSALSLRDERGAEEVRRRLRQRLRDWETVFELKPPFADAGRVLPADEVVVRDGGLLWKPDLRAGVELGFRPVLTRLPCQGSTQLEAVFEGAAAKSKSVGLLLDTTQGHTSQIVTLSFTPNGKLLATGSWDGNVHLWDIVPGTIASTLRIGKPVYGVTFTSAGDSLLIAAGNEIGLWDATTGQAITTRIAHEGPVLGLALSPNGRWLATAGADKLVKLWDTTDWTEKATLRGHEGQVNQVAFSADGAWLASVSLDKTARLWNLATQAAEGEPITHPSEVRWVAFSPDGKTLASSTTAMVKVWDLVRKRERFTLPCAGAGLTFGSEGDQLIAGHAVWELSATPRLIRSMEGRPFRATTAHTGRNQNHLLALADYDRTIDLCDVVTGKLQTTLGGGGYTFLLSAEPREQKSPERHLQILRNGVSQRSQVVSLPDGPVVLRASREGDRLEFQVNQLPPVVFHDSFPLRSSVGNYGVCSSSEIRLTYLHARRQALPPVPSPMETGDDLFARGLDRDALAAYEQQTRAPGSAALEARYKAALCLIRLSRSEEAATRFERLASETGERWPMLAACRLWLLRLEQKKLSEAEEVFESLKAQHRFEELIPLLPDDSRRVILSRYRESLGGVNYLVPPPDLFDRAERALRVSDFLQPDMPDGGLVSNLMIAAQQIGKPELVSRIWTEHLRRMAKLSQEQQYVAGPAPLVHYCWVLRMRGQARTALAELDRWLCSSPGKYRFPEELFTLAQLVLERVRIHVALDDWAAAEKELKECFRLLDLQPGHKDMFTFLHAHLMQGFLCDRQKDQEGARKNWRGGRWKVWRQLEPDHSPGRLQPPGFQGGGLFDLIGSGLGDDLSESEAEQAMISMMAMMGDSGPAQFGTMLRIPPLTLKTMWQSPRGKEVARALVFRTVSYPEAARQAALLLIYETLRQGAFAVEFSPEVDLLVWKLIEESFALYAQRKLGQGQLLQIGLAWKGISGALGWGGVAPSLPANIRGALAFVLGHRYLRLNKADEAVKLFQTAVTDLPVDAPYRKLAQAELDRLNKK